MNGVYMRFYTHEDRRIHGVLFYEWLLGEAKKLGIHGGTAFKAMAGYGRHGVVHESKFFELAGDLTVEVEFIVTEQEAAQLMELVKSAKTRVFFARVPAEFGIIEASA